MSAVIVEVEHTGPVVRVIVAAREVDEAIEAARDAVRCDDRPLPSVTYWPENGTFEVIFEAGDLA